MTPMIKNRIERIRRGEVPEGYKKEKDGIYPIEWKAKKIMQWLTLKERPVNLQDEDTYQLVTVRRGFNGVDSRGQYLGKDILVKTYFEIRQGDFIVSKRQIAHGACGVVPENLNHAVVSNEYSVFVPKDGTNVNMFNLMMQLPHYKRLFYLMSDGVHIEKLLFKTNDWMRRSLAMPPIEEQQKIAGILNAQDKVIELKEKLLTEKQRQRKYLMQQLMTGKKRLYGFYDEWKEEPLCDFCEFIGGGTPDTKVADYWDGDIPWISSSDIEANNFKNVTIHRFISSKAVQESATKVCPSGSIMIVSRVGVGKIAIAPTDLCTSQDFTTIVQSKHENRFLLYSLYWLLQQKTSRVQGSAIKGIPAMEIKQFVLYIPTKKEQVAIVEILAAADKEVELLQKGLEAEMQKKKALMQLLLTGIVRVNMDLSKDTLNQLMIWKFILETQSDDSPQLEKLICQQRELRFEVRANEQGHNRPHLHVSTSSASMSVAIDNGDILASDGKISPSQKKLAQKWIKGNKSLIIDKWNEFSNGIKIPISLL